MFLGYNGPENKFIYVDTDKKKEKMFNYIS